MKNQDFNGYTIKEVAEIMNTSTKTVRNKIKAGLIKAVTVQTDRGPTYSIDKAQFSHAQQIIETVKVKREHELNDLALMLSSQMQERELVVTSRLEQLENAVQKLITEKEELQKEVETLKNQKKPFWKFWTL